MKNINEYALLICDSNYGVHIPQIVVEEFAPYGLSCPQLFNHQIQTGHFDGFRKFTFDWSDVSEEYVKTLLNGCDEEFYWEAWDNVLNNLKIEIDGEKYHIIENVGAWLIPDECMNQLKDWLI